MSLGGVHEMQHLCLLTQIQCDPFDNDTELSVLFSNTYFNPLCSVPAAETHRLAILASRLHQTGVNETWPLVKIEGGNVILRVSTLNQTQVKNLVIEKR